MRMRIISILIVFSIMLPVSFAEQFKMGADVIKAKISYQNLNRISVKGDKIDSILGIDSAFHFEKNDKTGEVFLRPTEDNGYSPISLSIVTLSGKTQDLLLEPVEGEANVIELVSDTSSNLQQDLSPLLDGSTSALPEETSISGDYEEMVSAVMKKFINLPGNQPIVEVKGVTDRSYQHFTAQFESAYLIDGFLCLRFRISTAKEGTFVLDERMFTKTGDIALSLSALKMSNGGKVTLFVLRK